MKSIPSRIITSYPKVSYLLRLAKMGAGEIAQSLSASTALAVDPTLELTLGSSREM